VNPLLATALCLILLALAPVSASADQRQDFLAAEKAYALKDTASYLRLKGRLAGYPLLPYLEYQELRDRFGMLTDEEISDFLDRYAASPPASRLQAAWLDRLASERRWSRYLAAYDTDDKDITRRCRYLQALIATGDKAAAFAQVPDIWLHGSSRPDACDPALEAWRAAGRLTTDLVWARIALAFEAGSTGLAKYLGRYLPATERPWLTRWLRMHSDPASMLAADALPGSHSMKNTIIAHGIKRLGRSNPRKAATLWAKLRTHGSFTDTEACPVNESLAIRLEDEWDAEAYVFFQTVEPCADGVRHRESRIRAGLAREDWAAVRRWIDDLPEDLRQTDRWRYWKARALEASGHTDEAAALYRKAAAERTYYGFLAADRIDAPYHYGHARLNPDPKTLAAVSALPAIRRMQELLALDRIVDARREWWHATKRMEGAEQLAAARLYADWGWTDRAIFTTARADFWDDLELRFPLRHKAVVDRKAEERRLDPSWVFGVLRQESAFMTDVRSPAGAVGLMQLMPATAKQVARRLNRPQPSTRALVDADTNIALGTAYLRMMLDELGQHPVLATAAYNAGPHRVARWMPPRAIDADIWVELIPFAETRKYVQRVMAYTVFYDYRRGVETVRLRERMGPVRPG